MWSWLCATLAWFSTFYLLYLPALTNTCITDHWKFFCVLICLLFYKHLYWLVNPYIAHQKEAMVLRIPVIVWNLSIHYTSLLSLFNPLHSSTNQELFKKHLCIEVVTMKNMISIIIWKYALHFFVIATQQYNQELFKMHLYI